MHNYPINKPDEDSVILINKSIQWTSFDVVKKARILMRGVKTGHAGTLDPLASGLVIICTGKYTKIIEEIQAQTKVYLGTLILGATTDSYDLETEVKPTPNFVMPDAKTIQEATKSFIGEIMQVPPVYSAIKMQGVRAYVHAREGKTIEMKERPVTIYDFEITEIKGPKIAFKVTCSKGTYIRSLAHDFGQLLGTGAYLSSLIRTQIGDFKLEDAFTMEELDIHIKALAKNKESVSNSNAKTIS